MGLQYFLESRSPGVCYEGSVSLVFTFRNFLSVFRSKYLFKPRKMRVHSFNDACSFESFDTFESLYIFRSHIVKRLRLEDSILLNNLHGVMFHPDEASETCKFEISTLLQIN